MGALYLEFGGDLTLNQNGGLQMAVGWDEARQRIERGILTSPADNVPGVGPLPPDYIFEPEYGAGAPRLVGQNMTSKELAKLTQAIAQIVMADPSVDSTIPPNVSATQAGFQSYLVTINLTLADQTPGSIVFEVS